MKRRPPRSTPFPHPPLFRPEDPDEAHERALRGVVGRAGDEPAADEPVLHLSGQPVAAAGVENRHRHVAGAHGLTPPEPVVTPADRKSPRLNSSHANISYAVF